MSAYSIRELRAVALGEAAFSDFDYPNGTLLTEAAIREMFSLNEAYYGKATLKEIDEIMSIITSFLEGPRPSTKD